MSAGNLLAWWCQAGVLLLAGVAVAQALGWRHAGSRVWFLQALLVLALLLPALQPWRAVIDPALAPAMPLGRPLTVVASVSAPEVPTPFPWTSTLLAFTGAGVVLRLAWLALGVWRLRRYRQAGTAITVDGITGVDIREVPHLAGPASFGWAKPVILLPATLRDPVLRQVAIAHELQHVLRRDWLYGILEQVAAALLWCQPAVWLVLDRLRLAREQAVDDAVAGSEAAARRHYLESLLASAGIVESSSLPVTPFLRRRHLLARATHLTEEHSMTPLRLACTAAASLFAILATLNLAAGWFPLHAQPTPPPPPLPPPAGTVGSLRFLGTNLPARLKMRGPIAGEVTIEATVSPEGETVDARVLSGPEPLRKRALSLVLGMMFSQELAAKRTLPIVIEFSPDFPGPSSLPPPPPPPPPPPSIGEAEYQGVDFDGLTTDELQGATALAGAFRPSQHYSPADYDQFERSIKAIHPDLAVQRRIERSTNGYALRLRVLRQKAAPDRIRIGAEVQANSLVSAPEPVYPPLARQARIQGIVRFQITIAPDGSVERAELISGHPLLVPAAHDAMVRYRYKPTLLNGKAVSVTTSVDVVFQLPPSR